jgi:hypothetical protein|uniref:Uncharacterized protein n=1 Tax=Siphoviridae sp. ctWKa2 TaxID=2825537 RepID=A0A8S5PFY9_9CAUD|nr:MAG TPA: hypothetical protein [Siphoviridae sp. ctWKa2]
MITIETKLDQMKKAVESFMEISEFHFQAMETLLLLEGRDDRMGELKVLIREIRAIINGAKDNLNSHNAVKLMLQVIEKNDNTLEDILGMKPEEYAQKLTVLRKALGSPK